MYCFRQAKYQIYTYKRLLSGFVYSNINFSGGFRKKYKIQFLLSADNCG